MKPYHPQDVPLDGPWGRDICHGFFDVMFKQGRIPIPEGAKLLEVGAAEADFVTPLKTLRPDLHITIMDQRKFPPRPGADAFVLDDLLDPAVFPPASFDVVIACSVIEHVGIGRYDDRKHPDGDTIAMANIKIWLKPDGVLYMDVPYRPKGESTAFRQYNEADLQSRVIKGWTETDREYFAPPHPDGPYVALVLKP